MLVWSAREHHFVAGLTSEGALRCDSDSTCVGLGLSTMAPRSAQIGATEEESTVERSGDIRPTSVDFNCMPTVGPEESSASLNMTTWSTVVKKRPAQRKSVNRSAQPVPKQRVKSDQRRLKPVVGTGVQGAIKVVKTKMVHVFATKFTPDLDANTLSTYLREKLNRVVNCERIVTVGTRYSSFKVWAECNDVEELYNSNIWPKGSLVRRYFEPRKMGVKGTSQIAHSVGQKAGEKRDSHHACGSVPSPSASARFAVDAKAQNGAQPVINNGVCAPNGASAENENQLC